MKRLVEFPGVVAEATERRAAHALRLRNRVADDFHRFYHHHRVLEAGDAQAFRLGLCKATQTVIARALDLVGVEAPERCRLEFSRGGGCAAAAPSLSLTRADVAQW